MYFTRRFGDFEAQEIIIACCNHDTLAYLQQEGDGAFLSRIEDKGEIIGQLMITFEWSDWRNKAIWRIQSVYIVPSQRRKGIYRRLYEFVKARAAEDGGVCGFRLYVEKENEVAQRTYESLGMEETCYKMYEELIEMNR